MIPNVEKWLVGGSQFDNTKDPLRIIDHAADALNKAGGYDILNSNVFLGEDGKYYTVVVSASIEEAAEGFVNDLMEAVGIEDEE